MMTELEWMDIFGDNLVDLLKDANMSQRELADASGLSEATISGYIHKRKLPRITAIINIAEALDISIDDLVFFGDRIEV